MTSVETEKSFDIFLGRTQKMHSNMQKSSFFAENEGEKGILDGHLFWSHKTCCATKKDIAPENPDTTTVSGVFRAPIAGCKQKDIFLCPEDLNYRPLRFQAAFERCILPKAAFIRFH